MDKAIREPMFVIRTLGLGLRPGGRKGNVRNTNIWGLAGRAEGEGGGSRVFGVGDILLGKS